MHDKGVILDRIEREAHIQYNVGVAEGVSHLKLLQEIHDLALRMQHVLCTELAQADFHAQPVSLVE